MTLKWTEPDHTGFLNPEKAKKGALEDLFEEDLEKYNTCHGAGGKFCSGSGGGGGGGGLTIDQEGSDVHGSGSSDLPIWMKPKTTSEPKTTTLDNRPATRHDATYDSAGYIVTPKGKPQKVADPIKQEGPRDTPGFDKTKRHDPIVKGDGTGYYPGVKYSPDAREQLIPLVGKTVDVTFDVHHYGMNPKGEPTLMVNNLKIVGTNAKPINHMWVPHPTKTMMNLKKGSQLQGTGSIGEYLYATKPYKNVEVGNLAVTNVISKEELEKYNQCHGSGGKFCSGSGGGGGGGAVAVGPSGAAYIKPSDTPANLSDKKFVKPENITDDEYAALRQYGGTEYAVLNSRLRNQDEKDWPDKAKWMVSNIDSAIAKQDPLSEEKKVYRGTDYGRMFGKKNPEELVGAKILDKGFMSTSDSDEVASGFGNARFIIHLPAGMKALDMAKNTGTVAAKAEREWLLPRGTQLEIVGVKQTKGGFLGMGKKTYIDAKVVPIQKSVLEKYNTCHGSGGKFCSGTSGGGGGSFQNAPPELTKEESDAVEEYCGPGFMSINKALRGKEKITPEVQEKVKLLDSAMDKFPLKDNITVFRGIKSTKFLGPTPTEKKLVGSIISDKGFTSTSMNTQTAAQFAMSNRNEGVSMKIHVPKGAKALNIRDHIFTDTAFEEHEVLLHRDSKMRITSAKQKGNGFEITAEVI